MAENNGDHVQLFSKIDQIYNKIDEVKGDIHRLNINLAIITEKTKELDFQKEKIGAIEGRVNVFENDLNTLKYKSEGLVNRWEKIGTAVTQVIIILIGTFLLYKLNLIEGSHHPPSSPAALELNINEPEANSS